MLAVFGFRLGGIAQEILPVEIQEKMMKILQFGEGNFLRGFIEPLIERMNREADWGGVVFAVKPRPGECNPAFDAQDCRYHVLARGMVEGRLVEQLEKITCLERVYSSSGEWAELERLICDPELGLVISNTTEAGIEYRAGNHQTFPGKLARLLSLRARAKLPGVAVLPCELIEHNGVKLREYILAYLAEDAVAASYVETHCRFFDTLVDRIVAGFPPDAARYAADDKLLVATEPFAFMAIQADGELRKEFPFPTDTVVLAPDIAPYRERKVRCLNGSHTAMAAGALLTGFSEVAEVLADSDFRRRIETTLTQEILPTLQLPEPAKTAYVGSILERFSNPFAHHKLMSIALNSISKWRVRVLPVILDYQRDKQSLPYYLTRSLGELIQFYRTGKYDDAAAVLVFFDQNHVLGTILGAKELWGMDLRDIPGLEAAVKEVCE